MKTCRACGVEYPLENFHRHRSTRDGRTSYCKPCAIAKTAAWQKANPERARAASASSQMRTRNGMTQEEYDAMLAAQGGVCAICGRADLLPKNKRFDIDHCHGSGRVRGLLCRRCNVVLGYVSDDSEILRAAALYLEREPYQFVSRTDPR